ncbi:MAG: hypothetical protein IPM82_24180 [Saprospiraceae bacterium]|nr:hypothetical protein [Saprospiraceae bacterium]
MVRTSIFLFAFTCLLFSCKRDNPDVMNAQPVGDKDWVKTESGKKSDELKANSAKEGDIKGIAAKSLQTLQTAYKAASGKVPGVGDVTVLLDDNLNLIIENKSGLSTTTTQVNLKSIDTDFSHVEILSDAQGHEFPGFRIKVLPGKPKVSVSDGGAKGKEMDYLEVILSTRPDVEHSLSAITLAAQVAQNTLPIGVD